MIRIPLRPLARILRAREQGGNPDAIERENLRQRNEYLRDKARRRAEFRLLLLAVAFFMGFAAIGARMAVLAASPPEIAAPVALERIESFRGDIVDRSGRVLATNLVTNSLYAELRYMVDGARAAQELAIVFPDLDADRLARRLTHPTRSFDWIRGRLSPEQVQAVHDIGEPGLMFGPREMRLYPNGRLAAHVLGGATFGEQGVRAAEILGVAGIEHRMDARLRDPDAGRAPLALSLDLGVQATVAEVLGNGLSVLNARAGAAILMDAHSGEVLAMVSLPDFDPNARPAPPTEGQQSDSVLFNHAAQGVYELGSVMKAFAVAQALDLGLVNLETRVDTRGPLRVSGFNINDFRNYGPNLSVADVFIRSSNIGTARLAQMIGADRQREFLDRFGFLAASPIELPEATRARPQFPDRWTQLSSMTISYGHGLSTSPMQLAAGYAALVNGGYRVEPTLLRRPTPARGERLISEQTSAQMRYLMRTVVTGGTASMAEAEGYGVGGKTGTADKPGPTGGYLRDRVIATFAGAFPMHDPRYVLVVMLDEPTTEAAGETRRTAGWTAVPVAREIVARVAPLMGMRPFAEAEIEQGLRLR